jgi:threonine dehydrogenase-like Zn-dependent dehydrogenase
MRAAVLVETVRLDIEHRVVPVPGAGDVLIRFSKVGVCGSDAHYYRQDRTGRVVVNGPLVLGHEAAGIVAVGDGAEAMTLPTQLTRELVPTGVFRYAAARPGTIARVESGRVDLDGMVTGRFPLERAAEALDSDRLPGTVNSVVNVS